MAILIWVVVGITAGWLAGMLIRGTGFGVKGDLVAGVLGSLFGGYLGSTFGAVPESWYGMVSISAIGAVILVWILHLIHPGGLTA